MYIGSFDETMMGWIRSPFVVSRPGHIASRLWGGSVGAPAESVVSNEEMMALFPGYILIPKEGPKR